MYVENGIMYDSLCDLPENAFLSIYGGETVKNEIENICANCKWNVGICNCEVHAKAIGYINGNGVIVSCGMYERGI